MKRSEKYQETSSFYFHNENPKNKITTDCVLRAIAGATGISRDDTLKNLVEVALKHKLMPSDTKCYSRYLESLGWKKHSQPRKRDNTKYTGSEWCRWLSVNFPDGEVGNVIAHIGGGHIVCIKPTYHGDGINCRYKVCDTWDSTDGCIGNYWTKE